MPLLEASKGATALLEHMLSNQTGLGCNPKHLQFKRSLEEDTWKDLSLLQTSES